MRFRPKALPALAAGFALALAGGAGTAGAATAAPAALPVVGHPVQLGIPAYVWPNDPFFTDIQAAAPAPAVVILNTGTGPFDASWQALADKLRQGVTATGGHTKVIGYVPTYGSNIADADMPAFENTINRYINTGDGKLHVDGIFFDIGARDCGTGNVTRDWYFNRYNDVQNFFHQVDPASQGYVVDNPGTAEADCYLEPGHRTADSFVTFEGNYSDYAGHYLNGNVFNTTAGYYPGSQFDTNGTTFWHLIHTVPGQDAMKDAIDKASARGAGLAFATDQVYLTPQDNPWGKAPSWGTAAEAAYADAEG